MRLVPAWRKALAGRHANHRDDTHRHSGKKNSKRVDWMERVSDEQYRVANHITPQKRGPCDEQ
jgi:hypothetical protein